MLIVRFLERGSKAGDTPKRPHKSSHAGRWSGLAVFGSALIALSLLLAACTAIGPSGKATPTTPAGTTTPSATSGPATVKVFFTKHPDSDNNPVAVFAVTRQTTATTLQTQATFALEEMLKGPTQAERAQNYYSPFDGQLALQSTCSGPFRDFDLLLDHRGPKVEQGTATFQFCRRVDIPGDLAGPRMISMISSTLTQFPAIKQVVVLNNQGNCFADLQGANACLGGTQAGYPVNVYFSKHPDSDNSPKTVFAVNRTSPTLGVATYAISQLIAGPTAAEKNAGYFTPLEGALSGTSTCNGADVKITLNWNRTAPEAGTATMQFCRTVRGLGDTGAVTARNEITKTLTQFPSIKKVVIVYKDGACFDDLIGCGPAPAP